jgi:tRNA modification GTPase
MSVTEDTIFALSTCYGKSGIAVIRVSGPEALRCAKDFAIKKELLPRMATFSEIRDIITGEFIDEIIAIYFPKESSYTGQDLIELQVHGSIAIINKLLNSLGELSYMRLAHNGEFTRLALINGRISLSKAEALVGVMNAETELQRQVAAKSFSGDNEKVFANLKESVVKVLANAEAFIDFPEDTNDEVEQLNSMILSLMNSFKDVDRQINSANMLMEGIKITIVGDVNVGKSTLMNILTKKDTSIVSDIKGTTRDIVKYRAEISGVPVVFNDTAGIRESEDRVEMEGVGRALGMLSDSQIVILLLDINKVLCTDLLEGIKKLLPTSSHLLILFNKIDLMGDGKRAAKITSLLKLASLDYSSANAVSLHTEDGVGKFKLDLAKSVQSFVSPSNNHMIVNMRKQEMLQNCIELLNAALSHKVMELKAAELNSVAGQIGLLLGKIENEEILDELFSSFCIGK